MITSLLPVVLLLLLLVLSFLIVDDAIAVRVDGDTLIPSNATSEIEKHATLTLNGFRKGESGGGPSECDGKYHSDDQRIVALSTNWFQGMCGKCIKITADGKITKAKVVDECDTSGGCHTDIVDGSRAVWEGLGIAKGSDDWGKMSVTWKKC
ncbi:Putative ripening-related protein 7 [Linum perenne]